VKIVNFKTTLPKRDQFSRQVSLEDLNALTVALWTILLNHLQLEFRYKMDFSQFPTQLL